MSATAGQTIVHLIDDQALGGVTRMLDALIPGLSGADVHQRINVTATAMRAPSMPDAGIAIVHATVAWSKLPFLLSLRARMGRRPIVIVEHSYTGALERELVTAPNRFRRMMRLSYRFADRIVAVSEGQAEWLRDAVGVPASKLAVIPSISPSGSLADLAIPARRSMSIAEPLRLGACGRFCEQKGFPDLLDAMGRLVDSPVHLTLAGYGPDEAALRKQAARLPNVTINGPFTDPAAFLGSVDAVVIPSRWEAYGLLAMEARLAGRPLIVTNVDGLPEQVTAECGLVVPSNDPAALACAIRTLCSADLAALGANARASAQTHRATSLSAWSRLLSDLSQPRAVFSIRSTPRFAT